MTQQLHRSPYGMVVIVIIRNMNFLPIMKIAMRTPAARETLRSLMRNGAGKSPRIAAHPYIRGRESIFDFGGDSASRDRQ
ncbi:hypothetical protein JJE66_20445 [Bradyrhizobium diazoefficiens]|uniref:hypothetical protein n=1 Tax=Bradyrhizobium diazoefficiens TaxID=1355477 RepID=UPI00190B7927|nr:hypothetical protein [Bradyrhizobium diazoefficiens]MBK3663579.1 hypothetical protein [Bradyrhizobium diazoefficiens]